MNGKTDDRPPEIIIVRRPQVSGDGHHGGAWKIAFADFMTAMMALFLVLWLVNAANEETKKSVASYFNPVKLVDRHRSERGISDADGPSRKRREAPADAGDTGEEAGSAQEAAKAEPDEEHAAERSARFFEAPEATMDALVEDAMEKHNQGWASGDGDAGRDLGQMAAGDAVANDAFRDPFGVAMAALKSEAQVDTASALPPAPEPDLVTDDAPVQKGEDSISDTASRDDTDALRKALEDVARSAGAEDRVSIEKTPEGTLISIRADTGRPMFATGSAEPDGETVLLIAKLGEVLTAQAGQLRIGGHTDSAPFTRRDGYDNWRLSTDRAHAARLMLKRGGLPAERIAVVNGHAATRPLPGKAADYAGNRRITILLEGGGA